MVNITYMLTGTGTCMFMMTY